MNWLVCIFPSKFQKERYASYCNNLLFPYLTTNNNARGTDCGVAFKFVLLQCLTNKRRIT